MKTLLLLVPLLFLAVTGLAAGGQDVLIGAPPMGSPLEIWDVAAATDGTLFAVCRGDTTNSPLNIYRSNNGGSSWRLWDQLESAYTNGRVRDAKLATTSGDPGSLLVVWADQRLDLPFSSIRVSRASVADVVPTWIRADVHWAGHDDLKDPRIDAISGIGFQDRVSIAWDDEANIMHARSVDSGATFSSPLTLHTDTGSLATSDLDLAIDNNGVVHLAYIILDLSSSTTTVHYRRGVFGGEFSGNWAASAPIYSGPTNGIYDLAMAADHVDGGGGVIVAVGGQVISDPPTTLYLSEDQGLSWAISREVDSQASPAAAWGMNGPVVAASTFGTPEWDQAWTLLTQVEGQWVTEVIVSHPSIDNRANRPALALDPTRDDAPMVVGLRELPRSDDYALWFNATWRDGVGYGVPDPLGFFDTLDKPIVKPVLVGDMDNDYEPEIVIVQEESPTSHTLRALDMATGGELFIKYDIYPDADVLMLNVDLDSDLEVVYVSSFGNVEARKTDGSIVGGYSENLGITTGRVWLSGGRLGTSSWKSVVVGYEDKVYRLGPYGTIGEGWPWTAPAAAGVVYGRPAIGDVNLDGLNEIVVPMTGRVVIFDYEGNVLSQFGEGEAAAGTPSLTDFDGDGDLEIVIPRTDGTVHIVHHDGTPAGSAWPYDTGVPGLPSQVALADMAGDDRRDLVFMDAAHGLHVVTPAGVVVMQQDFDVPLGSPVVEPIVAQVGPGGPAVIVGASDGKLRVRTAIGTQEGWPRNLGSPILAAAAVADVDHDGIEELLVPTENNLWVLDMGVSEPDSLKLWKMSGVDAGRTGSVYDGLPYTYSAAPSVPWAAVTLHGAAPNPFNPATRIRFRLEQDTAQVSLRVYDVAGRLVRTLHQGALAAGDHAIPWRGDDESGRAVASGVYYGLLEADGVSQARPMVLAR